jgi:hypothetical protein
VRQVVGAALGLPSPDGAPRAERAKRANATPPAPAVASTLRDFIAAVNTGDAKKLETFIAEHFLIEPGSADAAARAQRFVQTHNNLGDLKIVGIDQIEPNVVEISAMSAKEGALTLRLQFGDDGKIKGVQVMVGG